jgi:hypothetical protein
MPHFEIEPGTYLLALAGAVVASCIDVVDTGKDGYRFAELDTGMTEVARPSLYGAQHPIDILTPAPGDPDPSAALGAEAGDRGPRGGGRDRGLLRGDGDHQLQLVSAGARGHAQPDGSLQLLRHRQSPEAVWASEEPVP